MRRDVYQRLHREERADGDDEADGDRGVQHGLARRRAAGGDGNTELVARPHVHRAHDGEVIPERDERREHADDDEPRPAVLVRRREDVELPDEAAAERQPRKAEEEAPHRNAEERPLPAEAREVVERDRDAELALARADHRERAERGGAVRNEIEEHGACAERRARREADEDEAGLRDRRVREHPLHIPLHERGEVSDDQRRDGDACECPRPEVLLARERRPQQPEREQERRHLGRGRHERRDRRRSPLVDVGCPHVERGRRRLEAEAGDDHREAEHEERVGGRRRVRDPREVDAVRRAVDERRAEEERGRSERADDEVLEPRLERPLHVVVDRAHDVQRDREPLERQEHDHQVRGADEERHPRRAREQEREELRDVLVGAMRDLLPPDERRDEADPADQHLAERGPAVAVEGAADHGVPVCAVDVQQDRGDEGAEESRGGDDRSEGPARRARHEDGAEQRDEGRAEQDEDRRDRPPVDGRRVDHLKPTLTAWTGASFVNEWCETPAGQAERKRSAATSGTIRASPPAGGSAAWSVTTERRAWWSTAEISRSMYIAASTIAAAPITAHHQCRWNAPARMRNSPANDAEPGTAREITPTVMSSVASAGRPFAIPPSSANWSVVVRRSIVPASRKSAVETRPCATICSTAPSKPRSVPANRPMAISPDCAIDE